MRSDVSRLRRPDTDILVDPELPMQEQARNMLKAKGTELILLSHNHHDQKEGLCPDLTGHLDPFNLNAFEVSGLVGEIAVHVAIHEKAALS